jgi:exopolysaccharide production protein ExoY
MCAQYTHGLNAGMQTKLNARRTMKDKKARPMVWRSLSIESMVIRVLDVVLSTILLVFLLPAVLLTTLITTFTDKGPVFFTQNRLGYKGQNFRCHKFRSMKTGSEGLLKAYLEKHPEELENYQIYRKVRKDPRITPFGRLLRKTSLDEVPQIFNVLKGEMSLVGPRPITLDETGKYGASLRIYKSVRPGITGLWQIMGRNRLSYRRRVALDRVYVRRRSIWLYLYILMVTVPVVLLQRGSH